MGDIFDKVKELQEKEMKDKSEIDLKNISENDGSVQKKLAALMELKDRIEKKYK